MKRHRITLSAFGTTGVLLAASLTMLALVSALVTFDAWPTRDGGALAEDVAVQVAPEARVVRAVRRDVPTGAAAERFSDLLRDGADVRTALADARGFPTGGGRTTPEVDLGDPPFVPPPNVPGSPPGEGDPSPPRQIDRPNPPTPPGPLAPVSEVTCGAAGVACGGAVPETSLTEAGRLGQP